MDFVTVRIEILLGQVVAPREHMHLNPIVQIPVLVAAGALYGPRNKKPGLHCPGWTGGRCTLFGEQGESAADDFDSVALARWRVRSVGERAPGAVVELHIDDVRNGRYRNLSAAPAAA
jgi:hypothetical protein